jgi:hypothetical protein
MTLHEKVTMTTPLSSECLHLEATINYTLTKTTIWKHISGHNLRNCTFKLPESHTRTYYYHLTSL